MRDYLVPQKLTWYVMRGKELQKPILVELPVVSDILCILAHISDSLTARPAALIPCHYEFQSPCWGISVKVSCTPSINIPLSCAKGHPWHSIPNLWLSLDCQYWEMAPCSSIAHKFCNTHLPISFTITTITLSIIPFLITISLPHYYTITSNSLPILACYIQAPQDLGRGFILCMMHACKFIKSLQGFLIGSHFLLLPVFSRMIWSDTPSLSSSDCLRMSSSSPSWSDLSVNMKSDEVSISNPLGNSDGTKVF